MPSARCLAIAAALSVFVCLSSHVSASAQSRDAAAEFQRKFQEAERALADGRYSEAAQLYEQLRAADPSVAEVHGRLGLVYYQEGKFAQAVPELRQALKLKPSLPNTDVLLAMSLSELGQYDQALDGLERGFRHSSDPALKRMAGLQLQRAYTGLRRDRKAVEVALELERLYPNDPEVLYHASRLYANFAYVTMQKLSKVAPESVWMHLTAGEVNESQGGLDGAIREYQAVLALEPRRPGVHFRLGRVYLNRARETTGDATSTAQAQKEFEAELEIDPGNANAAYEVAELHRTAGELDQARAFFNRALEQDPDFEDALVGVGRTLIALGKPDQALPVLKRALALNPSNEVTYYQLAQAHRALGNVPEQEKALAEFERLRREAANGSTADMLSRREVTRQKLDPKAIQ
jgi:tetratricopeptide (TPR) repeat protein